MKVNSGRGLPWKLVESSMEGDSMEVYPTSIETVNKCASMFASMEAGGNGSRWKLDWK